ncbi:MAG: bifunctional 2-C-methyl-D-erythritol 4-phosphate cytidylyltransferase/2-C-methyl-D-erythritol 2,4-cyclodiphosphate synthase [Pseudomonadota bacterium]
MDKTRPNTIALIVAAGRGERAGVENGPKQYQAMAGGSVLAHAVTPFLNHPDISAVRVVIHADDGDLYGASIEEHEKLLAPVFGGATRQASVHAGLESLLDTKPDHVLVHDAARPYVNAQTISHVLGALEDHQAALPCVALVDTIKRVEQDVVLETLNRESLFAAQTPQGFDFDILLKLHRDAASKGIAVTDDVALAEAAGITVVKVPGSARNKKLTTREDMMAANAISVPDVRVGHGYDTHQMVAGKELWLCGIRLDHSHGLSGHSDADVALHALTDALLSTIADGDIGSHFPPSDPKWKGARSDQFLAHAVKRVQDEGGTITHIDVTLLCEEPKIGPHRDAMRAQMAEISGIEVGRISVKATTNERIGFIGRQEGMVALATATVVMGGAA